MGFQLVLVLGLPFSLIAALMSFLITYGEYSHHFAEKGKILKPSIGAGLITLIFFIFLITIIAFFLNKMFL